MELTCGNDYFLCLVRVTQLWSMNNRWRARQRRREDEEEKCLKIDERLEGRKERAVEERQRRWEGLVVSGGVSLGGAQVKLRRGAAFVPRRLSPPRD
ncbi:hypothetical protein E2C01_043335 [Portunus trituberculatus]|uniref:Uncharacterized protein n=1 Tax=Portunus trituberculatus TaxID=210409 RepID=A0A5B7FSP6_PORTR|nr:hypothetical protein [Portunus trituberculatus]